MTRLHFTQKSSMSSPSLTERVNICPPELSLHRCRFRSRRDRSNFRNRLLLYKPARFFETDVFADPQLSLSNFEKIAHHQRRLGIAQQSPGGVFVIRLDFSRGLVVFRLHVRSAGNMRRPAKLLTGVVLHSV